MMDDEENPSPCEFGLDETESTLQNSDRRLQLHIDYRISKLDVNVQFML